MEGLYIRLHSGSHTSSAALASLYSPLEPSSLLFILRRDMDSFTDIVNLSVTSEVEDGTFPTNEDTGGSGSTTYCTIA